ncbi:hypothetical protein [Mesorhizobium sp. M0571]|uniref:hypothetical protein n=1 Tax=Mesorhizobium sp. M0571 TaxID=2956960 RepID=UPI0033391C72
MKSKTLIDAVQGVTGKWAKQRKQEERAVSARMNRRYAMMRYRRVTMKEAAEAILPAAWNKASGDGQYPASARQVFYAARGTLQEMTGKKPAYNYFSQTLLPDYIEMHRLDWDVVYDARGNYHEPHTKKTVPLGTLQVRDYLGEIRSHVPETGIPRIEINAEFPTVGPKHRFGAVLFIEKEGFGPLLASARIAERFDIAIMSTKGMSVTASRQLVENLCARHDIPLLVLHDFDVSGFTIAGTLQESTRRYQFARGFRVIDLGLRLEDVGGLEPEDVFFSEKADFNSKTLTLSRYGASQEEIDFLLNRQQRVELNSMTSPEFVEFLETKFDEHGIDKIVPDAGTLRLAALRAARIARMQKAIEAIRTADERIDLPENLEEQVRQALDDEPERTWDDVLVEIMRNHREAAE